MPVSPKCGYPAGPVPVSAKRGYPAGPVPVSAKRGYPACSIPVLAPPSRFGPVSAVTRPAAPALGMNRLTASALIRQIIRKT
jgi:hypothetical protein